MLPRFSRGRTGCHNSARGGHLGRAPIRVGVVDHRLPSFVFAVFPKQSAHIGSICGNMATRDCSVEAGGGRGGISWSQREF